MASYVKAGFGRDLNTIRLDLDSVELGLGRLVAKTIKPELAPIEKEVKDLLPFDSRHRGWRGWNPATWKADRDPGHVRDSIKGGTLTNVLTVYTTHPGGPVHWWGGTITPQGHPITIERRPGAGDEFTSKTADKVGESIAAALDRLCAEHGL